MGARKSGLLMPPATYLKDLDLTEAQKEKLRLSTGVPMLTSSVGRP